MERTSIESLIGIFRELTTELPAELLYRESDDCIELKSFDSFRDGLSSGAPDAAWSLISSHSYEAA